MNNRLGELLVAAGRLTPGRLRDALERQPTESPRRRLGELLVAEGWVTPRDVLDALGRQFGCLVVETIPADWFDPALIRELPVDWARARGVLPVRRDGLLHVLSSDPLAQDALADIALLHGEDPALILAPADVIRRAIEQCYFSRDPAAAGAATPEIAADAADASVRADDLLRVTGQAPATQAINGILLEALQRGASDVHIEPFETRLRLRFRIDGFLYEQPSPPKAMEASMVSRLKVMARLDIAEKRLPQDGMIKVRVGEREVDIRVSTLPVAEGERVVLRLLNHDATRLPLGDLGMPAHVLDGFRTLLAEPHGIVLVTGPTGSGKTTTLYAALQQIDTVHRNVLTIEDPIEYQLPAIGQMQVHPKIGLTFAQGLRHILRQDPDVVFVGEIRDQETAEIALRASLTGHLVFSTLHTNDAASAVVRLADMGLERYLVGAALRGVMAQRLVRRLCPHCRLPWSGRTSGGLALNGFAASAGCAHCLGGYRGRTGLYELLSIDAAMQEAVRTGAAAGELRALGLRRGMRTLASHGLDLVRDGLTSMDELLRTCGSQLEESPA